MFTYDNTINKLKTRPKNLWFTQIHILQNALSNSIIKNVDVHVMHCDFFQSALTGPKFNTIWFLRGLIYPKLTHFGNFFRMVWFGLILTHFEQIFSKWVIFFQSALPHSLPMQYHRRYINFVFGNGCGNNSCMFVKL